MYMARLSIRATAAEDPAAGPGGRGWTSRSRRRGVVLSRLLMAGAVLVLSTPLAAEGPRAGEAPPVWLGPDGEPITAGSLGVGRQLRRARANRADPMLGDR